MPKLKFYDLSKRKSFMTDKYKLKSKKTKRGMRYFAIATAPSKTESWRIISKDFYKKYK